VVDSWRKQINKFVETGTLLEDDSNLYKVFNRDFTNLFLKGDMKKSMFIDNPRDHSFTHANEKNDAISVVQIQETQDELAQEKNEIGLVVEEKIKYLSIAKQNLRLDFSGQLGQPLTVTAVVTEDKTFVVKSSMNLTAAGQSGIDRVAIEKRFKVFNNSEYLVESFNYKDLDAGLNIPFKELTALKNELAFLLNDSVAVIPAVEISPLSDFPKVEQKPKMSLLIADVKDIYLCDETDADVYFKLPESFKVGDRKYIEIFLANPKLIPWFPAVLIGKDYLESVKVLEEVRPKVIVSNNTGIAYKAFEMGIDWVAGPFLNTTNSYALLTLKEDLDCKGAFISNEINRPQIRNIKRPENFKLFYSIYHPILMMTSRQCFFQQTVGCKKPSIEDGCMLKCEKATSITNVNGISFAVDNQKGGYPSIYNHEQFLNVDAVNDLSHVFDEFFIDLTDIGSGSKEKLDKVQLIHHFENVLNGVQAAGVQLHEMVTISTNAQYKQGL
jgi:putative protease